MSGSMRNYDIISKLGSGGFATVHKARSKRDGKVVALKMIECNNLEEANQALQEGKMLLELDHPNIVRHIDFFLHQEHGGRLGGKMYVVLIMDFCGDGDLFNKLEKYYKLQKLIPEEEIKECIYQVCKSLEYLEARRIVHRDLKLANILNHQGTLKLGDFGISKQMHGQFARTIVGGTPHYMAPELLAKEQFDTKSDIWSLGCMLYELASCSLLNMKKGGMLGAQVLENPSKLNEVYGSIQAKGYSAPLVECLRRTLAAKPHDRWTSRQILNSAWLSPPKPSKAPNLQMTRATEVPGLAAPAPPPPKVHKHVDEPPKPPANHPRGQAPVDQQQYLPREFKLYQAHQAAQPQEGSSPDDLCKEADARVTRGDVEGADQCFRAAMRKAPRSAKVLCNYGYFMQVHKRNFNKAEEMYQKSLDAESTRVPTMCNYAFLLKACRRDREARTMFMKAQSLEPEHPWLMKNAHQFL